ncbi:pyruvate kinase [Paraburkholderia caballeronis]|uniref:pyruvate kinase n=1 Tax=Paraburkholderia caballeronis TaxID=416943 RepID=UPI0010669E35|nr:pyruvate kinase [Paraburkholderia caballeronis]TDV12076.1 pyruvate kinase [Paraburkholderia caballeronis]TDV15151.1 pyruvate kinase [Paraburkholderia caballeronis]TDV24523.1 pyruvate kinase [Paraburkholderia caballeronis]
MNATPETASGVSWPTRLAQVKHEVEALRHAALAAEQEFSAEIASTAPTLRDSAVNLAHYLAVRRHDLRALQDELARLGLSSLGRMEAHVMASLQAVLRVLHALLGEPAPADVVDDSPVTFDSGPALLALHTKAILGLAPHGRETRIMVTMPGEAADTPDLIRKLLDAGMGIMRINCAHDSAPVWERMVGHLRDAERASGKRCRVSVDLAGPKLRTGPIAPGPAVVKLRPVRNAVGQVTEPARVRLVAGSGQPDAKVPAIPVEPALVDNAKAGDTLVFADARGRKRVLRVTEVRSGECRCETAKSAYLVPGTSLALRRKRTSIAHGEVGALPTVEQWIALHVGDALDVVCGDTPGRDAIHDGAGRVAEPAFISCALAEVFSGARAGQPILFDDGKIHGVITDVAADRLRVEITGAAGGAAKLRSEKGINLPDSELPLPALTTKDIDDLAFVAKHADAVAMSFVQRPEDIDDLLREIGELDAQQLGIVLKIETKTAFTRLPDLLFSAMRHAPVAVMIARGDLGVEVGFERLSEVQEEMLWLCEAAHVPVIWATQVLESLAKGGMPSRAEVSDAAMGSRAECVMLNKGPYILETLGFLTDVLGRIEEHHHKKTPRLRKLRVASGHASAE